ncbi:hypothetical protein Hanom_Chr05g00410921 [Helianthus anomalus]
MLTLTPTKISTETSSISKGQQSVSISGETDFSEQLVDGVKRKWLGEVTSSKRPRTEVREGFNGKLKEYTVLEVDLDTMMFPEEHLKDYYWNNEEDKLERPLSPLSTRIIDVRQRGDMTILLDPLTNPIIEIGKVSTQSHAGRVMGTYEQNKYTMIRKDGRITAVLDANLADELHPLDIIKMKQIVDQEKGNTKYNRRVIHSISEAGRKNYQRAAMADFDLCITFEYSMKVHIPPPNTTVPAEVMSKARTRSIFETPELSVVFKDANNQSALFRVDDIYRYSNQTLNYIKDFMNQKQAKLKEKGKDNEQLRRKIEDIIEKWKVARGWYKDLHRATHKRIDHKID